MVKIRDLTEQINNKIKDTAKSEQTLRASEEQAAATEITASVEGNYRYVRRDEADLPEYLDYLDPISDGCVECWRAIRHPSG